MSIKRLRAAEKPLIENDLGEAVGGEIVADVAVANHAVERAERAKPIGRRAAEFSAVA